MTIVIKKVKKNQKRKILTATRQANGTVLIDYDPAHPIQVFFDTNVLLGLNPEGIQALKTLETKRGFTYRYSILNFVELGSHLGDHPSKTNKNPFRKYKVAFEKMASIFEPVPLPSPETVFMKAVGLDHYLGPKWEVKPEKWSSTLKIIADAQSLDELRKRNFNPEHYKKFRMEDGKWFLKFIEKAKDIGDLPDHSSHLDIKWEKFLWQFYNFLICRASSEKITFRDMGSDEQNRVIRFFSGPGGSMFLMHFVHLLKKILYDHKNEDANDFYDMLQLLTLRDENILFVTDDRPFHQYYGGANNHRVVSWEMFRKTASLD